MIEVFLISSLKAAFVFIDPNIASRLFQTGKNMSGSNPVYKLLLKLPLQFFSCFKLLKGGTCEMKYLLHIIFYG